MINEDGPREVSSGSWSHHQRIQYVANIKDRGEILQCVAEQSDDEGDITNNTNEQSKFFLAIKAAPLPPPTAVPMSAIGAIIGMIIAIILAFLFLAFAWHTRRWCFATPITVLSPEHGKQDGIYSDIGTMSYYTLSEKDPLLKSMGDVDIQTDDDPITKVTKYQTHLIMLADKLAESPDSPNIAKQTDSLARATANLLKNMAKDENDEHVKNKFLLAAKGLTESVGMLLSESDKSAAHPGDETVRLATDSALQQVKTESAESVLLVRTILLLRQLEQAARDAIKAAQASIKVARETTDENDNIREDVTALDVVSRVLEEKVENFSDKPSNADTQSYLIIGSKRFLEPSNTFVDKVKEYIQSLVDEETSKEIQSAVEESDRSTNALKAKIYEAEMNLLTLDVEVAAELIKNLINELETLKDEAKKNQFLTPVSAEQAEEAREALNKATKKVRWGLDQVFQFAIDGDKDGVSRAAQDAVPLVADFKTAVGRYAATSGDPAGHEIILDCGVEAVNDAAIMMSNAHRTVLNPANPLVAMNLLKSSNHVGQKLKATMLSNPDMLIMNSHKLTKSLGDELDEFQAALDALQIKPLPGQCREFVSHHLKESDSAVKNKINDVVNAALKSDKNGTNSATKDAVLALDDYKNATKEVATIIQDKNIQGKIIKSAQQVLSKSADMFLEAQNVLKTPGNEANAKKLQETASHIVSVMKELEKTYIFGAPGQEQYVSALNIMKHATKELKNPSPMTSGDEKEEISTVKSRLTTSTMEIAQLAQDILTRSNTDPERLDGMTPRLAQQYKNLTSDINTLLAVVGDDEDDHDDTKDQAISLGKNIVQLIEHTCVQQVLPGHDTKQAVAANAGTVAECSVKLLTSANTLAKVGFNFESKIEIKHSFFTESPGFG